MDTISADLALQAILGRGDFIGGIDNEALDFSQLEAFINSEGPTAGGYFTESLSATTTTTAQAPPPPGKLLNVIVENKRQPGGHALPDSPPDSGSEHPYSPAESCDPPLGSQDIIYTTLGHSPHLYKPGGEAAAMLNPLLPDNLMLAAAPIVGQTSRAPDNTTISEGRLLLQSNDSNGATLTHLDSRQMITQEGVSADGRHMLLSTDNTDSNTGRQILIQPGPPSQGSPSYSSDRSLLVETNEQRRTDLESSIAAHSTYPPTNAGANLTSLDGQLLDTGMEAMYTSLPTVPKKRKLSAEAPLVKSEPEPCAPGQLSPAAPLAATADDEYATSESGACLADSQYQCIRFQPFQQNAWHVLCDQNLTELPVPHYRVDADKGFNFSNADDAFVCQKKNHFQITCHVQLIGDAQFVKTAEGLQKINSFHLHFYGVKYDCPTQTIRVEQSQSDRSKKPFHPVLVELVSSQVTKVTVGRLHFSETTSNNMRKKGKPNPEQRYFQLVVGLHAHTSHGHFPVASHASQRIIVRASNPGQFESDVELCWQKGQTQESIFHAGRVGINTDRPDESLVIHGNLKITGHIIQPSDLRAKKNIVECDTAEQLRNVQRLRVVRYEYAPGFASQLNLNSDISDTGVIAQEVAQIIPEAVSPTGDIILDNGRTIDNFLVVNKERIFMENVGAVKELCKVTDNLETRIGQLERINRRLNKLKRDDSLKSNSTVSSSKISHSPKCHKHHSCQKEQELCSNKFIQIVIVILVLIMAFCLAAITTLYLMEASRHNQLTQSNIFTTHTGYHTKRPTKTSKLRTSPPIKNLHHNTYNKQKVNEVTSHGHSVEGTLTHSKSPMVIGRPPTCHGIDGDIDPSSLCQVYCCAPVSMDSPEESVLYEKTQKPNLNLTKTQATLINMDKNKISNPFHSNNIDKQRQKRDSDVYWTEQDNIYDNSDTEQYFTVIVQGRGFNITLTNNYCLDCHLSNITYLVPISKYMADEYITVLFKSNQANMKELVECVNEYTQPVECAYLGPSWEETRPASAPLHQLHEHVGLQQYVSAKTPSGAFHVDLVAVHSKTITYRASLTQNQNICQLPESKLGLDYIEYNLNFYRDCEE